jgi:predicted DNA-binding transcriptional regulator YafY
MTRRSGGDKRNSQLVLQRRLCLVRLLMRSPHSADELIAQANAAFPRVVEGIYVGDTRAALRHDLAALRREFGCEIVFGRDGRYVLEHPGTLAPLDLPDADLEALAFLRATFAESSLPNADAVAALLDRIAALLPATRQFHLHDPHALRLDLPEVPSPPPELLARLRRYVGRQQIRFAYRSSFVADGSSITHDVSPYAVFVRDGHTYLEGYCHQCSTGDEPNRYTLYRLDRMEPNSLVALPTRLPPGQQPRRVYRLRYHLSANIARQRDIARWFPQSEVTFNPDGSATVVAQTHDLWQARQVLLRYRHHCHVVEPPELVAMIRETLALMIDLYAPTVALDNETA